MECSDLHFPHAAWKPDVKEFSTWQEESGHCPWTSAMSQGPPSAGMSSWLSAASCNAFSPRACTEYFCFSSGDSALQAAWASLRSSMPLRGPSSACPSRIFCRLNSRVKTWQPLSLALCLPLCFVLCLSCTQAGRDLLFLVFLTFLTSFHFCKHSFCREMICLAANWANESLFALSCVQRLKLAKRRSMKVDVTTTRSKTACKKASRSLDNSVCRLGACAFNFPENAVSKQQARAFSKLMPAALTCAGWDFPAKGHSFQGYFSQGSTNLRISWPIRIKTVRLVVFFLSAGQLLKIPNLNFICSNPAKGPFQTLRRSWITALAGFVTGLQNFSSKLMFPGLPPSLASSLKVAFLNKDQWIRMQGFAKVTHNRFAQALCGSCKTWRALRLPYGNCTNLLGMSQVKEQSMSKLTTITKEPVRPSAKERFLASRLHRSTSLTGMSSSSSRGSLPGSCSACWARSLSRSMWNSCSRASPTMPKKFCSKTVLIKRKPPGKDKPLWLQHIRKGGAP